MTQEAESVDLVRRPSFGEAFLYWLKLGFVSFGGPAGQIAMLHHDLVEQRRWISDRRFLHALNFCMLLPGPEAQQLCVYIGWLLHRSWGGIAAGLLFVLPSLLILILLSWVYLVWGESVLVKSAFEGIKPAVVAILAFAALRIGGRVLRNAAMWTMAGVSFAAILVLDAPFPLIVLAAGTIGFLGGRSRPDLFAPGGVHGSPALIDDDAPPPAHARFSVARLAIVLALGLGLWGGAMALVGAEPVLADMGDFFTKAALVTFGGAYAVLPYVYQGGVETYGWLTATQMIDGLALGETTPGPLIMVVAFVGFVGGWTKQIFGPDLVLAAGIAGAATATFFTFLPSFLFILVGAPLVESTHGEIRFTAPLAGISAAVVGVVAHLALFFAGHVLWPQAGPFAWGHALVALAAFLALAKFKQPIGRIIFAAAAIGLARQLVG